MAMAVDAFHTQIASAETPVQDLVLMLGMKSLSGEITWALLLSERWRDIVRDGDEIRLGTRPDAEVAGVGERGPLVTFRYYDSRYMTIFLPKTCEVSYVQSGEKDPLD
jgi:hypothetical protein